jgi:hypothetical protein
MYNKMYMYIKVKGKYHRLVHGERERDRQRARERTGNDRRE